MERARRELQSGGDLYFLFGPSALRRHLSGMYLTLERSVAESTMPDRDLLQSALTLLRMFNRMAGTTEIAALGASSVADAELGFSNRAVVVAEPGATGWLWHVHGEREPRLARIAALPADTVFAVDFGLDLRPLLTDIEKTGCEKWISQHCDQLPALSTIELLKTLSGDWLIALAIPEDSRWNSGNPPLAELTKCDICISAPDERGALKKLIGLLRSVSPAVKRVENVTYFPNGDDSSLVFVTLDRRILFFSSVRSFDKFRDGSANISANGKFVPDVEVSKPGGSRKRLGDEPGFAAALKKLPANSNGAYFYTDVRIERNLNIGGPNGIQLALPATVNRSIGTWSAGDGMIVNRELSTECLTSQAFDTLVGTPLLCLVDRMIRKRSEPSASPRKKVGTPQSGAPSAAVKKSGGIDQAAECRKRLLEAKRFIDDHVKKHAKLPPALPAGLKCGNAGYVYFAPFSAPPSGKMPLVADPVVGGAHPKQVNVLFVDGEIKTFEFEAKSVKRLCSFLYTIYRYDEKEFIRLIERASQLDAEKGK